MLFSIRPSFCQLSKTSVIVLKLQQARTCAIYFFQSTDCYGNNWPVVSILFHYASTFPLIFCIYCWHFLGFNLKAAVRHMSTSFSFNQNPTKIKSWLLCLEPLWFSSKYSHLKMYTFVCFLYACPSWNSLIRFGNPKENLKTHFFFHLPQ